MTFERCKGALALFGKAMALPSPTRNRPDFINLYLSICTIGVTQARSFLSEGVLQQVR